MSNANFLTDPVGNASLGTTSTDAKFALGTTCLSNNGGKWVYVQAAAAITGAGYVCQVLSATWLATMITTAIAARGNKVAVPCCAFAINEYGWMQVDGQCAAIRVLASAVANVKLNTTATPGALDDDATTGAKDVLNLVITTTNGGAAATQPGTQNISMVGSTL